MNFFEEKGFFKEAGKLENESKKLIKDKKRYRRFLETQHNRVSNIDELLGKLPEKNEQIRIITQKAFNTFAILLYISEKVEIEELIISSYRLNNSSAKGIRDLYEAGNIKKITIVLSSFFNETKKPEKFSDILIEFAEKNKNVRLIFCWNHTKIMGVRTKDNKYYVVEGSGNMSNNAMIEQYLFEQSEEMFYFHKSWMEELLKMESKNEIKTY